MFRAAFYKSYRPGVAGLYNRIVRWWCAGQYSHCELIFSDGVSASASFEDGGVRMKRIDYSPERWDFIDLPTHLESGARAWFEENIGKPYDVLGNLGFVWRPIRGAQGAFFCSEAVLAALGVRDSWRYDPCCAFSALQFLGRPAPIGFFLPQQ